MEIPKLKKTARHEVKKYTNEQKIEVVKTYLFEGKSHRQIDQDILGLDANESLGYQTMAILHHFGLVGSFKGIFSDLTLNEGIAELETSSNDNYYEVSNLLRQITVDSDIYEDDIEAEMANEYEVHKEGGQTKYYTTRYERNPKNRRQAIKIHGTKCMACGFDFETIYGEHGKDYIEIHHIVPLSSISEEVAIDPETDLVVVCSNCHRMIHRKKNKILTIGELQHIIENNR